MIQSNNTQNSIFGAVVACGVSVFINSSLQHLSGIAVPFYPLEELNT